MLFNYLDEHFLYEISSDRRTKFCKIMIICQIITIGYKYRLNTIHFIIFECDIIQYSTI